jgi:hypothetical protein
MWPSHTYLNLLPLLSVEATGVCIPTGNPDMLLVAVYTFPQRVWNDADITELLRFRKKTILAGDLNAKHQVWNSKVSKPSGLKFLELFVSYNFEILTPQCPTYYTPDIRGDVFDIVVHQSVRESEVTLTDILEPVQLSITLSGD